MMLGRISGSPPVPAAPPGWDQELEGGEARVGGTDYRDLEGSRGTAASEEGNEPLLPSYGKEGKGSCGAQVNISISGDCKL
jgi:hypothetical protein